MSNEECEKVLKELDEVRPEKLNDKAKRLFEAIMKIADSRDKAESDLYEANNRINDLLDLDTQKDKLIDEIILYIIRHNYFDTTEFDKNIIPTMENIKKYFEERCK